MGIRGNPRDERYVDGIRENYELIDIAKDTGAIKNVEGFAVDSEKAEIAITYKNGEAEIIPFDEFPNGEIGVVIEPTVLSPNTVNED